VRLLKDRKLYDHADKVMTDSSDLVTAIRKDPKKYLTFHVKIFLSSRASPLHPASPPCYRFCTHFTAVPPSPPS